MITGIPEMMKVMWWNAVYSSIGIGMNFKELRILKGCAQRILQADNFFFRKIFQNLFRVTPYRTEAKLQA